MVDELMKNKHPLLEPLFSKTVGCFDVSVSIIFLPEKPVEKTSEKIALEEMQCRLNIRADQFADEIRKRMNVLYETNKEFWKESTND